MCPVVMRLIMNMYINQQMQVKCNSCMSDSFSISNWVKQGGVASPILFSCYIDNLLKFLRKRNVGCHGRTHNVLLNNINNCLPIDEF